MSSRDNLREAFSDIIQNQLSNDFVQVTKNKYDELINKGVQDEQAIELLGFYLEVFIKPRLKDNGFDHEEWKQFLDDININIHIGEYEYTIRNEKRNLKRIKDQYGKLKSNVDIFEDELFEIEWALMGIRELFQINSNEAKKIIHVVIDRILNFEHHIKSDYKYYTYEDILCLADGLEQILNPYINQNVKEVIEKSVEVNDENYHRIFKSVLLCLSRMIKNIEFWDKQYGKDGYFRFLSQYINPQEVIEEGPGIFFNETTLDK